MVIQADNAELTRYDLAEQASTETAMIFGELYCPSRNEWKFRAVGQGYGSGLASIACEFGVNIGYPAGYPRAVATSCQYAVPDRRALSSNSTVAPSTVWSVAA